VNKAINKEILEKIVEVLKDKKALDISVIEIAKVSLLADYFIICSGTSTTHIKALSIEVEKILKEEDIMDRRTEGYANARWILIDIGEIVVHIFHKEEREFYDLERMWSEGKLTNR
jgi:ribosome-associated protein